jgi:Undecaprenyl-phosphate galactose phosphotransferase WbaP
MTSVGYGRTHVAKTGRWKFVWRQRAVIISMVLADVALAFLIWLAAYALQTVWGWGELTEIAIATVAPSVAVWIGLRSLFGLYPGYGLDSAEKLRRHTYSVFATLAMLAIFALGIRVGELLSRPLMAVAFLGLLFLTPFVRYFVMLGLKWFELWGKPVITLGYKDSGSQFMDLLEQEWALGYTPFALFDYNLVPAGASFKEGPYEETLADAMNLGRTEGLDTAIFAMPYTRREQLASMVDVASESFRHVLVVPNLRGVTNSAVIARDLAGTFAVEVKHNLLDPWARRLKRALDLLGVVVGGLLVSPLLIAIVVLIKLDSPGPAFYGHRRLGARSEHFLCWKFRTMYADAERSLEVYLQSDPDLRAEWELNHKLRDDPRITSVGRLLRRTSLDELPQLWNVLRAEMSLIGPRPIVDAEVPKYKNDYKLYARIRPGMSGLWQVGGRSDTGYEERVAIDAYYVRNWSVWLDLIILARTVKIVLRGRGAY